MLLSKRYYPDERKKSLQEERVLTLPKHCIIPGFVTNGIMTSGGPAMFLSRNTAMPPLLKLFENKELSATRDKSNKLSEIKVCKVIVEKKINPIDAKELLPKWLNEGTMRAELQEVIKPDTCSNNIKEKLQLNYLTCSATEVAEILQPSSQSISRFLLLARFTNDFINTPMLKRWVQPMRTMKHTNSSSNTTASSYFSKVIRVYDGLKVKFNKSERISNFLYLLMVVLVTAASWKFMVVRPK